MNFWEYRGTLFIDRGRIINGLEEIGDGRNAGDRAVKSIMERAKQKDGTVSVYALSDEMVATLASVLNSKTKYRDLTTELTSLEKLISKLKKEEHSGYVEVLLRELREMRDTMRNGTYQFGRRDLPLMRIVKQHTEQDLPCIRLFYDINQTHRMGLAIDAD